MSRSGRNTPIFGIATSESEKQDKLKANRRLRRKVKEEVNRSNEVLPELREVSNVWLFDKDGEKYFHNATDKDMRK